MSEYWCTQRLTRRAYKRETDKGLDVNFQCDYMGSSEFEWGNIPRSLKEFRQAGDQINLFESTLTIGDVTRTVYFVCDRRTYKHKRAEFDVWVEKGMRGQESSHFGQVFAGEDLEHYGRTVAWWSLDTLVGWTLDPEIAPLLAEGLRGQEPSSAGASDE